jgi:dolichol-phosphate mannosyltransferase
VRIDDDRVTFARIRPGPREVRVIFVACAASCDRIAAMETPDAAETRAECATPDISVVVPCFEEQDNVVDLSDEIARALDGTGRAYEMLFVDDGSTDLTALRLFALTRTHATLRVLRHAENCGQSAAFATGFAHARAPVVVTLDGDGQNDPADIPELLAALETADVACGVRR